MEIPQDNSSFLKALRVPVVIVICLALLYAGVSLAKSSFSTPVKATDLSIDTVQQAALQNQVSAFGQLVPAKVHSLIAMVDGRVQQVLARPGQLVSAEQPLLQLVNPKLQRLLEEQELMLQAAQAEQLQVLQQLTQEELQLKHELLLAQGERKLLAAQLSAKQQLFEQQIVSALDFAQSEVLLEQAEQKLLLAGEKLQGFRSAKQSRLQAAALQLQRAQKQLDIAKQDVQSLQVSADITGQLIALDETLKPGSRVEMGQALGQVAEPDVLIAELKITAVDAAAVKINQRVQVNIKGKRMPGKVSWISPNVIDNFMRLDVTLEGELPDTARANIEISADITAAEFAPSLLSGKPSYVKTAHRRYPLFIKDKDRDVFVRRDVEIGEITSRQMQLGTDVALGEQILLVVPAALLERTEIKPEDLDG